MSLVVGWGVDEVTSRLNVRCRGGWSAGVAGENVKGTGVLV